MTPTQVQRNDTAIAFERDLGYTISFGAYRAGIRSILTSWLNRPYADPFQPEIRKPLQWGAWVIELSIDQGRPVRTGTFGLMDVGRPKTLRIHARREDGDAIKGIDWNAVNNIMAELLSEGAVTYEQVWFLFGTGWTPDRQPDPTDGAMTAAEQAAYDNPPCMECGAMTPTESETRCICNGDKDHCHGCHLWPPE